MEKIAQKFLENQNLKKEEFVKLIRCAHDPEVRELLAERALELRKKYYGDKVYTRGLIEFTNYCKNDCYYCGIRRGNRNAKRYRLTEEEILACCENGYELGFRTFVLQGGEDPYYSDERMEHIIRRIKEKYPECAVTLSIGERSMESYQRFRKAGADRYLLRHETADETHYRTLHPEEMSLQNRMECLKNLKTLGYQVGAGFMVGSPWQTMENLANDLIFLKEFQPHMVGIGPFLPHSQTPFRDFPKGSAELTLFILSLVRIMLPKVLLPATTALGTREEGGRERGILHGANVIMPNLSPVEVRKKYMLYDNKLSSGAEASEGLEILRKSLEKIGYEIPVSRGDCLK